LNAGVAVTTYTRWDVGLLYRVHHD